jgi:putative DNA primase/helicase
MDAAEIRRLSEERAKMEEEPITSDAGEAFALANIEAGSQKTRPNNVAHQKESHLSVAAAVLRTIGRENMLHDGVCIWKYNNAGLWLRCDDREVKKLIHQVADGKKLTSGVVSSILDLLKTEIFVPRHQWDVSKQNVNCHNGELHHYDGEWILKPHDRESFRTAQIPVEYDPKAKAPRFVRFLREIFRDDKDRTQKVALVLEAIGYSLLSSCEFEKFFLLIGPGANGKSVLMSIVGELAGRDNICAVQPSQFENRFQRAHLHGKLVNMVTEIAQGAEIADAQLKAIVSGELTTAEHKHQPPFDFEPFVTCWFGTNHMPHTRDFSDALFRRAIIIPFNRVFAEHEQDKKLKEKLKAELPGILNFSLEAMAGVFERGEFIRTDEGEAAKQAWKIECDQVAQFAEECCHFGPGNEITSADLYSRYRQWGGDAGVYKLLNRKNFSSRIMRLGATSGRGTGGTRMFFGITSG